jgi:lysophospholipase L1-like esterase
MNLIEIVNMKGIVDMKKTSVLLLSLLVAGFSSLSAASDHNWEKDIAAFEKADAQNPPPKGGIEFVGSSTIVKWTTLTQDFPNLPVFNRGFGGSQVKDTLIFAPRIIIPYAPRIVVFHSGGNDLQAGVTPAEVIDNIKKLVELIQAKLPQTEFCFIGLRPSPKRSTIHVQEREVNKAIQEYMNRTPRTHYIDEYDMVIDAKGDPRPELFNEDNLHLNADGYKLLVERVRPFLEIKTERQESKDKSS